MEHQLRTPFSGVYSIVQSLSELETDPQKKELLTVTYQSAKEFLDLLNKIIDFSRNQIDNQPLFHMKFDLYAIVDSVVTMLKAAATEKKLTLSYEYSTDLEKIFIGDPNRIQRLLLNLLGNAIHFTHKGKVKIKVNKRKLIDDKHIIVQLRVSDTGIGIPQDKLEFIYEKFYRLHPANQNKYKGAGLGLYIVKQIVEELGGEISVKSEVGKGSTFICTLSLEIPLLDELDN